MGGDTDTSSSSGEEDGNAEWRAAIDSVAATTTTTTTSFRSSCTANGGVTTAAVAANSIQNHEDEEADNLKPQKLKHYQIKAQKLLDDLVENSIEIARNTNNFSLEDPGQEEGGIRLFKHAPPGVVFDYVDELQQPRKKPRLLRGEEIDEKSKKFRCQVKSVVVDGLDIIAAARDACQKALTKLVAKDAAAKVAAQREEERVAELKRIRGERWLPSIAREMQSKTQR